MSTYTAVEPLDNADQRVSPPDIFGPLSIFDSGQGEDKRILEMALSHRRSSAETLSLLKNLLLPVPDNTLQLPSAQEPSKDFSTHSRCPKSGNKSLKSVSKRTMARSNLKLIKLLPKKAGKEGCKFSVRLWKDHNGIAFYDCSCEGRIPSSLPSITTSVKQVHKIEKHLEVHEKRDFACRFCRKVFKSNHLQLNAHEKTHKKIHKKTQKKDRIQTSLSM